MADPDDDLRSVLREPLPAAFERWREVIAPGSFRPTDALEWAGALVLVERGVIEVCCVGGGRQRFVCGDLLALEWLPLETLSNPGPEEASVVAIRRRRPSSPSGLGFRE